MRRALTVLTVCAAAATFAACGEEENASAGGGGGTSTGEGSAQDAVLAYARCMREHGVDMPDPQVSEDGGMVRINPGKGAKELDPRNPEFDPAHKACEKHMRDGIREISPEQRAEMEDKMLKLARCMRGEGLDFPDPQPGQGLRIDRKQGEDPRFQAAQKKCHKEVGLEAPGRVGVAGAGR